MQQNLIFSIEGNIGAGKSTILKHLHNISKNIVILPEPVDMWLNLKVPDNEKSLFEMFYQDNKKYGFMFQMYALQTRYEMLLKTIKENPGKIIICERCMTTDNKIFADIMFKDGIITGFEYEIYKNLYGLLQNAAPPLTGIIYLKTSNVVCANRIITRDRSGENSISIEYIKKLNNKHDEWILSEEMSYPVLTLDGDEYNSENIIKKKIKQIEDFLKNFTPI